MADTIIELVDDPRLRAELQVCRRRGAATAAVGGGGGGGGGRQCGRCRAELGRVINRGACCRWCRHRVCKSCRHYGRDASDWLCTVCHKQMEVTAASGDWMGQFVRRPSKRRIAAETVKRTLQRSWTFTESSVSPWSALRGSPEMRAYSSMPRHQDWEDTPAHALPFRRPPPPPQQPSDDQMEQNEPTEAADTVPDDSDTKAGYESSIDSPLVGKRLTSESASSECEPSAPSPPPPPLSAAPSVADVCVDELFRRVTLKKRRLDSRDLPPGVTPPRARRTAPRPARPPLPRTDDPDDYRLVFISSSDSSSREELCSDDSTGDWDYYTPGGGGGAVDLGQYQRYGVLPIPFPVPIPVPILVPVPWSPTVHLWSMQQLVTVQLGEGIVCGTVEKRRDDEDKCVDTTEDKCEKTTEDKCGGDTVVTETNSDEVNNELNETIRNDSVAKKESAGSVNNDKVVAEQEASVDLKSVVALQTSCGENSEEVIKDVCNIDVVDEEAEQGNVTAANDAVNGEAELGLGPCDASQVNCVDSLKDDEIVEETDGVVLKTHRPLEEVRYTAKEPCDSMESDSDSSSDEEAEKNKRFYKLNEEEGSEESDGEESGEFSMASSRSSSSEGRFKRVYVVNDSDSDLGELPDQGEDEGEEEGEVTLLSHVNMEVDSLDLPEAQQREVDEEKDQEDGCEKDATAETAEFISKEVENSNRAGGELVKEVEGDRSSNSDEFSGTESMELEHQGQSQSARYTSLVMITQQDLEQPVSVVSVPETRRQEDEVEVDEKRFTLTLDTSQDFLATVEGEGEVRVVTGNGTTAVVILEEGLPDDDSWVEDLDRDDIATTTEESSEDDATFADREEELRGYNPRSAIDFTLHTIVEESCEESEAEGERRERLRPTEMERYFMFGVAEGDFRETDTMSETSSMHSEDPESLGGFEDEAEGRGKDPAELASSRLEKYFLSGLLGYGRRDSDGSVGSDSEGRPSPEQRRKRLVRARGTGRLHSNSLDNLNESEQQEDVQPESEGSSTETDSHDDLSSLFERGDGQFDTVKRTKKKKRSVVSAPSLELLDMPEEPTGSGGREEESGEDGDKTPQPEYPMTDRNKQQSRDSGFMGSCDDLLKEKEAGDVQAEAEAQEKAPEAEEEEDKVVTSRQMRISPQAPGLIRKDSFNNWSSDEETNLMMSKMRQFFKTMVANQSKSSPSAKPPQLVHFESELTRLMKTVPGIRDEQVKEIVEYLSSEDTWSDSYDSSDYTSSDLEGAGKKSALQEEISASCRQIISNFETVEDASGSVKDTAFVYQRLVASFSKLEAPSSDSSASHNSPPLIAKVMQHIGSRLVALMHEVSSADGGSPKASRYHRRLQPKLSTTSTTEDEEEPEDYGLPRSKSHDPLIEENRQEASDNERFSWRGSFESALMASDSRTRLASGGETSSSASALALAAKRRSAGDLLFKTSSREQLDRVRSCGSIGGSVEDKIWGPLRHKRRRSSVPDSGSGGSNDGDDDSDSTGGRSTTLPRGSSLLQGPSSTTNSLPRLPTTPAASPAMFKAHSVHQVGVVSARYRPPGFGHRGAVPPPPRRDNRRHHRHQQTSSPSPCLAASAVSDDASVCSESVSLRAADDEDRLTMPKSSLGARSDSMASVYSGAGEGRYGTVTVRGEVEFGVQYNYKQSALEIYVKQCRDLAAVDAKRNRSDPYVKVYLLPDKSKSGKRKTKVKKHTLNPVFEETLKFQTSLECVASRTLWLSVWHSDMFGRNDFLGEVTVPLADKVFDDPLPKSYPLQERSEPLEEPLGSRGELIVGLKFVPPEAAGGGKKATKGCLHVLVKEAKNLAAVKSNGTSDPFCKSYLLPDKGRSSKQKTGVQRRSVSPVWNHTFTYGSVTLADLAARSLELTVWDHDRLASNEFLGGVRLNLGAGKHNGKPVDWMDARNKETTLWQRMMERPNLWVESCLPLRASLGQPRDN